MKKIILKKRLNNLMEGFKGGLLNEVLLTVRYHWNMGHRHNATDIVTRKKWLRQKKFIQ